MNKKRFKKKKNVIVKLNAETALQIWKMYLFNFENERKTKKMFVSNLIAQCTFLSLNVMWK